VIFDLLFYTQDKFNRKELQKELQEKVKGLKQAIELREVVMCFVCCFFLFVFF